MTDENPDPIAFTSDGAHWLQCFAGDMDAEQGQIITEVSPGSRWGELAEAVRKHQEEHGCALAPSTATDADPGFGAYRDWERIAWPKLTEEQIAGGWRPLGAARKAAWAAQEKRATDAEADAAGLRDLLGEVLDEFERVIIHAEATSLTSRSDIAEWRQRGQLPASG